MCFVTRNSLLPLPIVKRIFDECSELYDETNNIAFEIFMCFQRCVWLHWLVWHIVRRGDSRLASGIHISHASTNIQLTMSYRAFVVQNNMSVDQASSGHQVVIMLSCQILLDEMYGMCVHIIWAINSPRIGASRSCYHVTWHNTTLWITYHQQHNPRPR